LKKEGMYLSNERNK